MAYRSQIWSQLWVRDESEEADLVRHVADFRERALEQSAELPAITAKQVENVIKALPASKTTRWADAWTYAELKT